MTDPDGSSLGPFVRTYWQLLLGSVLAAAGFAGIVVAWVGTSGTNQVWAQVPYLVSGGLGGLALVVCGVGLLVSFYLARLGVLAAAGRVMSSPDATVTPDVVSDDVVATVPGGTRFHRLDCALVEGKPNAGTIERAEARERGLEPCGVCLR